MYWSIRVTRCFDLEPWIELHVHIKLSCTSSSAAKNIGSLTSHVIGNVYSCTLWVCITTPGFSVWMLNKVEHIHGSSETLPVFSRLLPGLVQPCTSLQLDAEHCILYMRYVDVLTICFQIIINLMY